MKISPENPSESEILETNYQIAVQLVEEKRIGEIPGEVKECIEIFIHGIDSNKSLVQAIVTSILKKRISPEQDIRLHKEEFERGYSARGLDTRITAPFFKKYFPKYANKETAFLTMATRASVRWDFEEGQKLPLRNKKIIFPFLSLIDKIQNQTIDLDSCMIYIFANLYILSVNTRIIFDRAIEASTVVDVININTIIKMLEEHFASRLSSRLPVIAIHAIYQEIFKTSTRYTNKILLPLNVHTASDKHGYGDIEICNADRTPFEMVEVKHNIPINRNLILDVTEKAKGTSIQRYYILTTFPNCFKNSIEEEYVSNLVLQTKKDENLEIIPNGILHTLKYYLRFVEDYNDFLETYTSALILDASNSTEVQDFHIEKWQKILQKYSKN